MSCSSSATMKIKAGFAKRQLTLMKKASELSTLCGIDVCVICYGLDGTLQTWPNETAKVREMAEKYKRLSDTEKAKRRVDLLGFLEKTKFEDEKKKKGDLETKYPSWDKRLDEYSAQKLSELDDFLERKLQCLQERLGFLEKKNQQKEEGPSTVKVAQSSNSCKTLEIHPSVFPNFATANPNFSDDQHVLGETQFPAMPCNYYPTRNGNLGFADSGYNQSLIPQTRHYNPLASGVGEDWTTNPDSLATVDGNYPNFMMPQNGGFEHSNSRNGLTMNKFNNSQLQFPQIQSSASLLELGQFSAWAPGQPPFLE